MKTLKLGTQVGRKSTFEISFSSRPYFIKDLALRPCFNILIGFTFISLYSPMRYAHTSAMQTIARSLAIRSVSRRCVEAGGFHSPECGLDFPSPFIIGGYPLFGTVVADETLKFRHTVRVLDAASGEINVFPLVKEKLVIRFLLPHFQGFEEPPCTDSLPGGRLDNPEVLPDSDIIPYMIAVEPIDLILAYELPVSNNTVNAFGTEQPDKAFHNSLAFLLIGIPFLRQKAEHQWEGNPLVSHAEHEDVDVEIPEFPVCAVHAQHQSGLDGKQREYYPCHKVKVEGILSHESLDAAKVGLPFDRSRHCRRKFMEAYGLYHTQGMKHESHELYAC